MKTHASESLKEIFGQVESAFETYRQSPGDVKKARRAATFIHRFHEWAFKDGLMHRGGHLKKTASSAALLTHVIKNDCPELAIVRDMAGGPKPPRRAKPGESSYAASARGVFLLEDGRLILPECGRSAEEVLATAVGFWRRFIEG